MRINFKALKNPFVFRVSGLRIHDLESANIEFSRLKIQDLELADSKFRV